MNRCAPKGYEVTYGTPEYNEILKRKSLEAIRAHPFWVAGSILRRLPRALMPQYDWMSVLSARERENFFAAFTTLKGEFSLQSAVQVAVNYPGATAAGFLQKLFVPIVVLLAFIGIVAARKKGGQVMVLLAVPLYFVLLVTAIHVEARYLLPAFFAYFILAGYALYYIGGVFQKALRARV